MISILDKQANNFKTVVASSWRTLSCYK